MFGLWSNRLATQWAFHVLSAIIGHVIIAVKMDLMSTLETNPPQVVFMADTAISTLLFRSYIGMDVTRRTQVLIGGWKRAEWLTTSTQFPILLQ
jgi:hypothetical protein